MLTKHPWLMEVDVSPLTEKAVTIYQVVRAMKKIVKLIHFKWKTLYPAPESLPRTRSFWIALGIVALATLAYIVYFSIFLTTKQDAFRTNGEDLGIMDQAIWSLLHGSVLHQTICNVLTDTNCYGLAGIPRFAIHFEPILFPIALLYLLWSDPKALLILQVLVVASGAFPAFWLARLRLRNAWAALPFALLYLLYPTQQYAVNFDFHAETLTSALLLFAIYFLYTRKALWCLVFVILCLACKEEIAGVIFMLGLWTLLLQRRVRFGLGLLALSLGWTVIGLLVVHAFSPIGHSLLASRYSYLGQSPLQVALTILTHPVSLVQQHLLETAHMLYLRKLLAPAGYLPLLAPWVLLLAAPTLALNLLSSTPNMYSGDFQYNAEIIPILVFASIEATVLIVWIVRWFLVRSRIAHKHKEPEPTASPTRTQTTSRLSPTLLVQASVLTLLLCYILVRAFNSTVQYDVYSAMPYAHGFIWPSVTTHNRLAARFLAEIPPDSSVSTQTNLVPHLSERKGIYLFPYAVGHVDYILLDATSYPYPFKDYNAYAAAAKATLQRGDYGIVDMGDGYLLLKRGYPLSDITPALQMIDKDAHTD
ncbi:MAG TPA: DUF2079 domain-containing protein [Ktedonobacteraceae bacterium]|nr:DUF2079 domain-containing protein [Ktedonobacteraceae bacterium]